MAKEKLSMTLPPVVSERQWQTARRKLLVTENALTRKHDALAAERRRMPMVKIGKPFVFEGPDGKASLRDLFDGRRQLIIYHFMFAIPDMRNASPQLSRRMR